MNRATKSELSKELKDKFDKAKTKPETFHAPKGDVTVDMMSKVGKFTLHYNTGVRTIPCYLM